MTLKRPERATSPVLDPIDRLSELMFGLLMTLTFTGTMSVALGDGDNVRSVLFAALGCNLAWGIVDGTMYVLTSVTERGRDLDKARAIRTADPDQARRRVQDLFPEAAQGVLTDSDLGAIVARIKATPDDGGPATATAEDLRAAGQVFLLVVAATLPPAIPFLLVDNVHVAMRGSNLIAVLMLIAIGWRLDQLMGLKRAKMRIIVPIIGCLMVATTIALGG